MLEQTSRDGQRIGNYRLLQLLGRGGFAEVYLAEHIHLNTRAAVKLLNTQLAKEGIEDFRNEARMIAGLVHPHIVRVLDFGVEGNVPYLVMDYAPNGTLRQRHAKGARLPLQIVVSYVQQMAGALHYAHEQRLIHRDVKPENMLVARNGEILLSDFGIALVAQSSHYQKTQNIAGTLAYMAPEQIQAHPRPASDQYSLAIAVYEWLGGQRPFQGTMTEIAIKHATATPPPLRALAPDLPPAVEHVVLTALQKDPHARFSTTLAFAQALEHASGQFSRPAASNFVQPPPTGPAAHRLRSQRLSQMPGAPQQGSGPRPGSILTGQAPLPGTLPYRPGQFPDKLSSQQAAQPAGSQSSLYPAAPPPSMGQGYAAPAQPGEAYPPPSAYPPPPPPPSAYPPPPPPSAYSPPVSYPPPPVYPPADYYVSAPPQTQTGQPQPLPNKPSVSRRKAIAAIVGSAAVIAGCGLAAGYAYFSSHPGNSGPSGLPGVLGAQSGQGTGSSPTTSTAPLTTFSGHTKIVWAVSWSPNGKYIASASDDGTSHIWNVSTKQLVLSYRSRIQPAQSDDGAYSVAWLPDSSGVVIGFADGTAQIVSLLNHQQTGSFNSETADILSGILYAVAISPDGRSLALAGFFSNDIQIFDIATQQRVRMLSGHTDIVWALSWSHNGKYIASASSDATARIWDAKTGKTLLIYSEQGDDIRTISWSPDDARVVSGGLNGAVYIWAADSGQTLFTYGDQTDFEVLAAAWSHNGKYIATGGGSDDQTHILNAQNGQLLYTLPASAINGVSWSLDDTRIAVANDTTVQIWQVP